MLSMVVKRSKIVSVYYGKVLCLASHCHRLNGGLRQHLYNISMAEKNLNKVTDCVGGSKHFINQKAVDTLSDIWDKHATLYPVILEDRPDEPYYMVVVHTVIDCIDREQSVGTVNEFEDHEKYGYFDHIDQWVFREEEIGDNILFVLPDDPSNIYATETFKQRIIDARLSGFGLVKEHWDETAFIS